MSEPRLPSLPLGESDFTLLRESGSIYVDKTALIAKIISLGKYHFIARPRRFGKSLLISTLESLFRHGLRDFKGLAIENLWDDATYDVVRLDFSEVKSFATIEDFERQFDDYLIRCFSVAGFRHDPQGGLPRGQIAFWMRCQPSRSLVLLIDEYDAPLTETLDNPELFRSVRLVMNDFFLKVKANSGCLRFFFMTGITKLSGTGFFSAFNSLYDHTLNPEFGTLLGYTEEEIERCFPEHLAQASRITGMPHDELMRRLRENYDGFSFDEKAGTHVFTPWSTLMFLTLPARGFLDFWYESGGRPAVLIRCLRQRRLFGPSLFENDLVIPISTLTGAQEYDRLNLPALLVQTGYLTIKEETAPRVLRVGYPNLEVSQGMARLFADELLGDAGLSDSNILNLPSKLALRSDEEIFEALNRIFHTVNYDNYPVRDESTLRFGLQMLLLGGAMVPSSEVHSALGRSDLEVNAGRRHWVFELKYAKNSSEVARLLEEGVSQIRSRRYGVGTNTRELCRAALVFDGETRQFAAWRRAD